MQEGDVSTAKAEIVAECCRSCDYCVKSRPEQVLEIDIGVNSKGYEYMTPVHLEDYIGCIICGCVCLDGTIEIYK